MGITYRDHLIDSGYYDITPEQEREIEAREECARRDIDPDDYAADGVLVWMVVDQELRLGPSPKCELCLGTGYVAEENPPRKDTHHHLCACHRLGPLA